MPLQKFPAPVLEALELQVKLTKSSMLKPIFPKRPIACYIYEANIISELELRFKNDDIDKSAIEHAKTALIFSDEAKHYITRLTSNTN